ncbi:uncharacterized protein LOC123502281 isoform X2 [Portunus trituberculatus]|uniref:uncharacterized protein LOC123502281 isoform X2 n=1 Tax=Portunus trituberculatus TaxID=210409 RepID=UPI001E1D181C|nr:uncharacterized protein LOC123502281 isoform X2 [Portunus trituberculatus]
MLEERRVTGDMITMFKIVHGVDILDRENLITMASTNYLRGHPNKILKDSCTSHINKISARHRSSPVTSTTSVDPATETTTTHKLDLTGVDDPKA